MTLDLKITGAMIADGDGGAPWRGDIGVKDGRIVELGEVSSAAARTFDAEGALATPGFLDIHTHYDGQASWDAEMRPSIDHGVTTAVMGSCGVGFAPARPSDHDRLIRLMEGVEDIPGSALAEGLTWEWESFPQYLDALERQSRTIDIAAQMTHDPLRVFVMGERALFSEQATEDDVARMRDIVREGMKAGAVGFSTGRTDIHKTADGDWTPASEATTHELTGIASAFDGLGFGAVQAVSDFNLEREGDAFDEEFDIIEAYARAAGGRPFSMSLMQRDFAPDQWKRILSRIERLNAEGVDARVQVAPRAIGVILGLQCTFHPFMGYPSYKKIADKPLKERVAIMKTPEFRAQLLAEKSDKVSGEGSSAPPLADMLIEHMDFAAKKLFALGDPPDYAQPAENAIGARAERDGVNVWEALYDAVIAQDGEALIYLPIYNYTEFNYDNVLTMLNHPKAIMGLGDGGAHVGTICDASFPTFLLSYWARDRAAQAGLDVAGAVKKLTSDLADFAGFSDRGRLRTGLKADINIIDVDELSLAAPRMIHDLPAGGQRLLQDARGYRATFVSGRQVADRGKVTDERPGRLVRFGAH